MLYRALACDYDGTLANSGKVAPETLAALRRLLDSGRKLILVTGRFAADLQSVFPHLDLFERVVAENGALLVRPARGGERLLAGPPPQSLIAKLEERGVRPLETGRVMVATGQQQERNARKTIRELGLDYRVILNKGAVMILPAKIDKATGLQAALEEMRLSSDQIIGVGDAENDVSFLGMCGFSAAVADALPVVRKQADWVATKNSGEGVAELIDHVLSDGLRF